VQYNICGDKGDEFVFHVVLVALVIVSLTAGLAVGMTLSSTSLSCCVLRVKRVCREVVDVPVLELECCSLSRGE
jgi:MFS superfamily sulfate permease-like transporter